MAEVYKGVGTMVARMAGDHPEMDNVAHTLLALARFNAEQHRLTGNYIANLHVKNVPGKKRVRDRLVIAGDKAAISIEYGHAVRVKDPEPNESNFKWVPGQFILTDAIAMIPGHRYTDSAWGRALR